MLSIIIDYNYNITYRIQNIYRFFEGFEEEKILVGRWTFCIFVRIKVLI